LAIFEPFGEDRADIRAAVHTAAFISSMRSKAPSEGELKDQIEALCKYLPCQRYDAGDDGSDMVLDDDQAAALRKMQGG